MSQYGNSLVTQERTFAVYASVTMFWMPTLFVVGVYARLHVVGRRRLRRRIKGKADGRRIERSEDVSAAAHCNEVRRMYISTETDHQSLKVECPQIEETMDEQPAKPLEAEEENGKPEQQTEDANIEMDKLLVVPG